MRVALAAVAVGLLVLPAAGCGGGDAGASDFQNTPWVVASGSGITLSGGIAPSILFLETGTASGNLGCNRFTIRYTLDGDSLELGPVAGTHMACPPPADDIESAYLAALANVAEWGRDGEQLVLSDADGNELLRYDVATLLGEWTVTGVNTDDAVSSAIGGTEMTASFGEDGTLAGSAGCNSYTSTYEVDQGSITIEVPAATRKLCPEPEGIMEQETAFLGALAEAETYLLDGTTLTLRGADETTLVTLARAQQS